MNYYFHLHGIKHSKSTYLTERKFGIVSLIHINRNLPKFYLIIIENNFIMERQK